MATSGSTSAAVTAYDSLIFTWTQLSQSIPNNTTTISWMLQLKAAANGKIISSASKAWSVTVNGVKYSGTTTVGIEDNSSKVLASGTTTIAHNADGSKSFAYSFSQEFGINFGGTNVGTISGSGSGVLNTVPRATTPKFHASSVDMGGTLTIYTYRASESFKHDLAYAFAGSDFITFATNIDTYYYWAVPLSLADKIPNASSGTVTIRCTTKNGSTVVGTTTAIFTAKVPASVVPTINDVRIREAEQDIAQQFDVFIQNKSRLQVGIDAAGARGSTIKSYSATLLGKTYTGEDFTTEALTHAGDLHMEVAVTDSRGRTTKDVVELYVWPYYPPQVDTFHVARYNDYGLADSDGTRVGVSYGYGVAVLNDQNTAEMSIEYKRTVDSDEAWEVLLTNSAAYASADILVNDVELSTDYQYDLRLVVIDWFGNAATYSAVLPSGAVILDIRADGKGLAFFKTSTKDGVDIDGELPGSAISLTNYDDLNDLTIPGFYVIPTASISGTVSNKPYTDTATASIRVEDTGGGTLRQVVQKSTKTDGTIYERGYGSGSWGSWSVVYSGAGKTLWTGSSVMPAGASLTFSEPLSHQQSGIVLVFSRYISGAAQDYYYSTHFVPKQLIATTPSSSLSFIMATSKFEAIAAKYLIITNTGISGNEANDDTGTMNGVTFANNSFALRYVIGV